MTPTRTAQTALLISFIVILGGSAASDDGPAAPGPGAEPPGLRALCSRCHLFTPPDLLPRALWSEKIEAMFRLGTVGADASVEDAGVWLRIRRGPGDAASIEAEKEAVRAGNKAGLHPFAVAVGGGLGAS